MSFDSSKKYSLSDLKSLASVSPRTVRYYIAEGLLPPPVVAGARSYYTQGHLDRLRLIGHLKSNYLPLREIRKRMAGMDDAEVSQAVAELGEAIATDGHAIYDRDTAANYLARVMEDARPAPLYLRTAREPEPGVFAIDQPAASLADVDFDEGMAMLPILGSPVAGPGVDPGTTWRRISLGDDVELLVREEAYLRNLDRIEWLQDWARKVFS